MTDKLDIIKKRFVELYRDPANRANVSTICKAVGISRQTFYDWLKSNQEFAVAFNNALEELRDDMEQVLHEKAADGNTAELIFWLKNNHPKYKEQRNILIQQNFSQIVEEEKNEFRLPEVH